MALGVPQMGNTFVQAMGRFPNALIGVVIHGLCALCGACSPAPKVEQAVEFVVVQHGDYLPIAGALISTGACSTIPSRILGETDAAGRWGGVLRTAEPDPKEEDAEQSFRFVLEQCWVWVTREGYVPKRVEISSLHRKFETGCSCSAVIPLVKGQRLWGRIVCEGEVPVQQEPLLIVATSGSYPIQFETATDADGRFEWKAFPGGEAWLALGLGGADASPVFQSLEGVDREIMVFVPRSRQRSVPLVGQRLLYVEHSGGNLILPDAIQGSGAWVAFELALFGESIPSTPIRHLILAISDDGESLRFLAIHGKEREMRQFGEVFSAQGNVAK